MSAYPYRLTVAVPAAHIANASAMGICLAATPDDAWAFTEASWQDTSGNLYAVASGVVGAGILSAWGGDLAAPPVAPDVDLTAAATARNITNLVTAPGAVPMARTDQIAAYLAANPSSAGAVVTAMGLTPVPVDI